ncbi:arginine-tRNA-protein transferase [Sistotremastrum niveocremeum HHB9708]|uniref:Arginine-tRNA-protein transferase n=1 Tax=Sistotremastrum niveocremeum HHB9708 TaxID=1314777 RepID=A0A164ZPA4_9AGAM|nr:arginine-tRNA-protein transferase [Sistotremastrum niveocremeum HHB9708]
MAGFKRFLVDSPLLVEDIPYPGERPDTLPRAYGTFHQLYHLDGRLVAMSVLDILPRCVSSVYFIYHTDFSKYSMGKLSALRETSLANEINKAGIESMKWLYMGFYIHSCPKMRYKGEYSPSELLDPVKKLILQSL